MEKKKNIYIAQFDKLSTFLKGLNDTEIQNLESGRFELKFEIFDKKENHKSFKPHLEKFDDSTLQSIVDTLNQLKTREEGLNFLTSKCSVRTDFELIAKKMDIPFQKKDTVERLKEKIIESSIGFKLRSQAIQGNNEDEIKKNAL